MSALHAVHAATDKSNTIKKKVNPFARTIDILTCNEISRVFIHTLDARRVGGGVRDNETPGVKEHAVDASAHEPTPEIASGVKENTFDVPNVIMNCKEDLDR